MPHISLAYDDVTKQNIGPLMERLAFLRQGLFSPP